MIPNIFPALFFFIFVCFSTISGQLSTVPTQIPHLKNSSSQLYCLGGKNEDGDVSFSVSKLNTSDNQWKSMPEMSTPRGWFGASVIGKKIYVCGGSAKNDNKELLNLLEVFDCEKNTWNELSPMPNVRDRFGMTTLDEHLYVAGGVDGTYHALSSVLKYSPETNSWSRMEPMNEIRHGHELVTLNGAIYAIGGYLTKTVERHSPILDKWSFVSPTHHSHAFFGAAVHQNKIYILSENGFEVYDPESNTWQELLSLSVGSRPQLISINNKLWAVGVGDGNKKGKASKTIFEYNTSNNSWIYLSDMNVARYHQRAVIVDL